MSTKRTDSNVYTIVFAVILVVVVGSLLAFFANATKEMRDNNDKVKTQIDILSSMGVEATRTNATEMFGQYIKKQYVVEGTTATENAEAYLIDVKKEQDAAKAGKVQRLPLFIGEKDGKTIYIFPVRGNGLWDAIWGYVALNDDLKSIYGVFFDHKGETPGLGANITESFFKDDFKGEMIYDKDGNYKSVTTSKSNADPNNVDKTDNEVDAISGATITSNGVSAMLKKGISLYLPYFETLKK
ncbi:NADH:ubiquinone reductase (Na(+)-transporting) subunit C [Flavobacterium sp. NRK F10]|uniref:Na(+)-translocating NADH-quinone reductase subunit C n=1 Tax=Flavobacterium sediminis TaxID=2201181 RepID=A0A2U8QVX6_9FLAO|nr:MULTISPECIES: NADH:ubiquinone reductase (Na(+)-transporting) subunit C [Flavobacterium]AWM14046.1 NADH:ubiquinone reductase (Na(+)-transporting) subunit C [Flavobacterium sediminis]MCO6175233.1 NADH:ubiquinone reductase (Na(+)-transporting) subunit C [Flavobacterium sp. NRK F10]